jgi:hypothetical protein
VAVVDLEDGTEKHQVLFRNNELAMGSYDIEARTPCSRRRTSTRLPAGSTLPT